MELALQLSALVVLVVVFFGSMKKRMVPIRVDPRQVLSQARDDAGKETEEKLNQLLRFRGEIENRKSRDGRRKMIGDYGLLIEACAPTIAEFRDIDELPHGKYELLDALLDEIVQADDEEQAGACAGVAPMLAQFQEGVGSVTLSLLGIDLASMPELNADDPDHVAMLAVMTKRWKESGRADEFEERSRKAEKERNVICELVSAAIFFGRVIAVMSEEDRLKYSDRIGYGRRDRV